jgi:nitric oxide reductase NorD protein
VSEGVRLAEVRRRLELVVTALYDRPILITPAPPPTRTRRIARLVRRWLGAAPPPPAAANDGERIILPAELGGDEALSRYRLMAIAQAERIARGTAALAPAPADARERDLYLLFESAAVDAASAEKVPGLRAALAAERSAERARRGEPSARRAADRQVEAIVHQLLSADAAAPPPALAGCDTPEESLRRARAEAARIRAAGRYRGVPPVSHWGSVLPPAATAPRDARPAPPQAASDAPVSAGGQMMAQASAMDAPPGDAPNDGTHDSGAPRADQEPSEEGTETGPPDDSNDEPPGEQGLGASEVSDEDSGERPEVAAPVAKTDFVYPEWDYQAGRHRVPGAIVRIHPFAEADGSWSKQVLEMHAALARRVRQQFERLRARRAQLPRQRRGEDLDLAACVQMLTEMRAGYGGDDRLYTAILPARRDVAIVLLVDISGSTSEIIGRNRIIDVEKFALLLTGVALDALGDPYAILCFSGATASNVRMRVIKAFGERNGEAVRRRVDALQPEGFTRMGAAVRHATAVLREQPAGHRLLLILSDGKPNDEDAYDGRYGVEDSRQAIAEARGLGIHPFCLTIDLKGGDYLPRIFGPTGHVVLHRLDLLPTALLSVIREIFRR